MQIAIIGLLVVAVLTDYSCMLMVRCKYLLIDKLCEDYRDSNPTSSKDVERKLASLRWRMTRFLGYGDLVSLTLGRWGLYVVNFCIIVTQAGFCMNYFIVIGNTMEMLFPLRLENVTVPADLVNASLQASNFASWDRLLRDSVSSPPQSTGQQSTNNATEFENTTFLRNSSTGLETLLVYDTTAWPLPLLVIIPLPLMAVFALFRTMRQLSIVSIVANSCLFVGFFSILFYLVAGTSHWVYLSAKCVCL